MFERACQERSGKPQKIPVTLWRRVGAGKGGGSSRSRVNLGSLPGRACAPAWAGRGELERADFAAELGAELPALQKALAKVAKEEREKEATQHAKNEAMAKNDATFTTCAGFVAASCQLAGLADIAPRCGPRGAGRARPRPRTPRARLRPRPRPRRIRRPPAWVKPETPRIPPKNANLRGREAFLVTPNGPWPGRGAIP
jgi:hypothetical protein